MKGIKLLLLLAVVCLVAGPLYADIYEWTDENGVKHFTNYAPPDDATILIKTEELPHDEAADQARMEDERQFLDELARMERAAREAELEQRVVEAERRAAEAERNAREMLEATEQYLKDDRNSRWYYRVGPYYPYYPVPYRHHDKRKYHKTHSRYDKKKYGKEYHRKQHLSPPKHGSSISVRLRTESARGSLHIKTGSRRYSGRGYSRVGSYGYRR